MLRLLGPFLLLTPVTGQESPMAANLVVNPRLSVGVHGPSFWALNRSADNRVDWCASADGKEFALRLQGSGADWAGASSQAVAVTPGGKLTVVAWLRSDVNANESDRLFVRLFGETGFMGQEGPPVPGGLADWKLVSQTVVVPEGARQADVSLQIRSTGVVWLHSAGLFRGDAAPMGTLPAPAATEFAPLQLPRGRPADDDANGLPDVLERALGITAADKARSARLTRPRNTSFQTPTGYREDNDLKVDIVIVAGNNADDLRSWRDFGYTVHCMGGFRAGEDYVARNPGEVQTDSAGHRLDCGPGSYYMVPTAQRRRINAEYYAQSVGNGARAVCPEEPEFFNRAGYSEAFKAEWQAAYGEPWQDPTSSVDARLKAERLKAQLEQQLLTDIYTAARETDPQVTRFLLAHSPLNYSAWGITFAHCAMLRTGLVDEMVAQVWTGTARSAVTHRGRTAERTFENGFLEYSSAYNLVRGLDIPIWFLMDPLEDNPNRTMEDYLHNYERTLGAALMFPEVTRYEVMPWPTRIFGRVPEDFATVITSVVRALGEMAPPAEAEWDSGTRGIATFIADSAGFQRGLPGASDMDDLYGLCLPLLMQGLPVQIAHLDRVTDPGYLDPYHTLLLSHDAMKPQSAATNEALAAWVRRGGSLMVFGGEDAYCAADEWWRKAGFHGPTEHLLSLCGLRVDERRVVSAEAEEKWQIVAQTDYAGRNLGNRKTEVVDLSPFLAAGEAVHVKFEDTLKGDGWGPSIFRFELAGTQNGKPVQETVLPGSPREAELIYRDDGSALTPGDPPARFTDATRSIIYRLAFDRGTRATLRVDLGNQYRISATTAPPRLTRAFTGADGLGPADLWALPATESFVTYAESGGTALLADGADALVLEQRVGKGRLAFCGLPGRHFTASEEGDRRLRALVRHLVESSGREYVEQPHMVLRRGEYLVAKTFDGDLRLPGRYLNILQATLPVVEGVELGPDRLAVLKVVEPGDRPRVLHCSSCIEWKSEEPGRVRLIVSDALGVRGACRLWTGGRPATETRSLSATGEAVDLSVEREGETLLLRYEDQPNGIAIELRF
jgi:hypothetical protein